MSEELGDGDLAKNHAAVYRKLIRSLGEQLPEANTLEFIESGFSSEESTETWKSAVTQLLISLFPNEFLPEILGFNMQFECLTWDTVRAARELKELGIDNYYFLLHISIDNSDTGHTAMALEIVKDYLNHIKAKRGDVALNRAWKRVQVGFLLSEKFAVRREVQPTATPWIGNRYAPGLIEVFKAKRSVAAKLHCASRVKIGGKKLSEWLDQHVLETEQGQDDFLTSLSKARPWVRIGNSAQSKLVNEFEWNGKMFGAFTKSELELLKNWIDALGIIPPSDPSIYWNFTEQEALSFSKISLSRDICDGWPAISDRGLLSPWNENATKLSHSMTPKKLVAKSLADVSRLMPLWFAHPCLLESFVSIPILTCNATTGAVLRTLRAQRGFAIEDEVVAGMEELRRTDCTGLIEIGLEMMRNARFPKPRSLRDVMHQPGARSEFAINMLHWSMRPVKHRDALLRIA
ncbi:hypothetical protein F4779DRAFT_602379 [Xylariaceae sp. FL0662B]|nr:hypothetical protein F4779DRAFT_602379 [Xylariaceae sp. FL0662B]